MDYFQKDIVLTENQKSQFKTNGFLEIKNVFDKDLINDIRSKVEPLFDGKFSTGIWPDEWNYRKQLSLPNTTREIVNIWKCDPFIARVVMSEKIGKMVAEIMGWSGARLAQDELFYKVALGGSVGYHQDGPYMDFTPQETIAVWVPLNDVSIENGTLEYAIGSHKWKANSGVISDFHNPLKFKTRMEDAAKDEGYHNSDSIPIHRVTINKGDISLHDGFLWHGSSKNPSNFKERCAFAFHFIPENCEFKENPGYIYGRYKLYDSNKVEESFFPITYSSSGKRSVCCDYFCSNDRIVKKYDTERDL